jgi:hypothetical protein
MITARAFLDQTYLSLKTNDNLKKYYLYKLTNAFDTNFIIDLNKIKLEVQNVDMTMREALIFVNYIISQSDHSDLNTIFYDYLRLVKSKEFIKQELWSFLYSLEIYQKKYNELSILIKILSSTSFGEALRFFMFCRNIILKSTNKHKDFLLDDIYLNYTELNSVLQQIFGQKTSKKIHIIQNISEKTKASVLMFKIIKDWLNHKKENEKKQKIQKSKSIQNVKLLQKPSKATIKKSVSNVKISPQNIKQSMKSVVENIRKEKYYLIKSQEDTETQINKLEGIHTDLNNEYNKLLIRGKKIYETFFEIYYNLKLKGNNKFIKFPVSEKESEEVKKFSNFKKIYNNGIKNVDTENHMYKIVECDYKFDINDILKLKEETQINN